MRSRATSAVGPRTTASANVNCAAARCRAPAGLAARATRRLSGRSKLAQAIRYTFNHWNGLIRFLDDGRLGLDTNIVERAMRPIALGRKNALFAGADSGGRHWSIVATLIQTAELNDIEPLAWLTDVLTRMVSGQTKRHELDRLLPCNWKLLNEPQAISSA
jgi:transposase